jgi:dihydrofolate synthase/folylpolyglutamate synthase
MTPAEQTLFTLPRFAGKADAGYKPGLDRMRALLAEMGNPHEQLSVVHVAGTNGKGSTCAFAAALLQAHGLSVGLHTSPHLWRVHERMRIDGADVPDRWLDAAIDRWMPTFGSIGVSFFEATAALALLYFAEREVDAAVVEVGLGGRLDATNVVSPVVTCVAEIGLDHVDLLGGTRAEIAREKAGIFKPGAAALTNATGADVLDVLAREAHARGEELEDVRQTVSARQTARGIAFETPYAEYAPVRLGLAGHHQIGNAVLALRAVETLAGRALDSASTARGFEQVVRLSGLRGRLDQIRTAPRIVADVAHNPDGIAAALRETAPKAEGTRTLVLGLMADKDAGEIALLVARSGARVVAAHLPGERALNADTLALLLRGAGVRDVAVQQVDEALEAFAADAHPDDVCLVTGSHVTVAAIPREYFAQAQG